MPDPDAIESLLALRAKAHRIGAAPLTSAGDLVAWIDERSIALVSGRSALPNAAEAIAGRAIEGSWWGDPDGSLIYRLLTALELGESRPAVDDLVLVDGKRTLVSHRLVPAVCAVAANPERRRRVRDGLRTPARQLLDLLTDDRAVRAEDTGLTSAEFRKARGALESGLLARSTSVHTESGHHASVLEAFGLDEIASAGAAAASGEAALRALFEGALRSAVVASRREMDRWFRFVEPEAARRSGAIDGLGTRQLEADGGPWLTLL